MQIEWVELIDFRSYRSLALVPESSLNILSGANGQGKTNLLEGLGVLLAGRSFRGARLADVVHWEASAAQTTGSVRRGEVARELRRRVEVRDDGRSVLTGEGCPWVRAVPFGWSDLSILTGGPQARRNFLDGLAAKLFPAHVTAWRRYRQVLGRRNHLLQTAGASLRQIAGCLEPWNEQLAQAGAEVRQRRSLAVAELAAEVGPLYVGLGGAGSVRVQYQATQDVGDEAAALRMALERRLGDEMRRGQTLEGPHRDDLEIALDGRDARVFASRGQQRVLALVLRLAEARGVTRAVGSPPILLLDDALSELDAATQERVARYIGAAGQVFLTTAEREVPLKGAAWWQVEGGRVIQVSRIRGAA